MRRGEKRLRCPGGDRRGFVLGVRQRWGCPAGIYRCTRGRAAAGTCSDDARPPAGAPLSSAAPADRRPGVLSSGPGRFGWGRSLSPAVAACNRGGPSDPHARAAAAPATARSAAGAQRDDPPKRLVSRSSPPTDRARFLLRCARRARDRSDLEKARLAQSAGLLPARSAVLAAATQGEGPRRGPAVSNRRHAGLAPAGDRVRAVLRFRRRPALREPRTVPLAGPRQGLPAQRALLRSGNARTARRDLPQRRARAQLLGSGCWIRRTAVLRTSAAHAQAPQAPRTRNRLGAGEGRHSEAVRLRDVWRGIDRTGSWRSRRRRNPAVPRGPRGLSTDRMVANRTASNAALGVLAPQTPRPGRSCPDPKGDELADRLALEVASRYWGCVRGCRSLR